MRVGSRSTIAHERRWRNVAQQPLRLGIRELFARAQKLRWICASRAGLGGAWLCDALVNSDVVVTGMHGSYNEHLSTHAVAFLLAFARRFEHYLPQKRWQRGPGMIDLPTKTVLIVGSAAPAARPANNAPLSGCVCFR
jgi:phosphoglycerate dehydrogenase-like enzyme